MEAGGRGTSTPRWAGGFALATALLLVMSACVPEADPEAEPEEAAPAPEDDPEAAADADGVNLDFTIWTFDVEGVQSYIDDWEQAVDASYTATLSDTDWGQYHDAMVANFVADSLPDVMYVSDHWLAEWASGGWLVPVDEVIPSDELGGLVDDMFDYAREGMTYRGELYGLPYYADPIAFVYNTRHYEEAGITEDPQTWEDVLDHARTIKEQGVATHPIGFGWSQDEPFSIEVVTAMLMSRGEEFFDDNLDPTFTEGDSTLSQHIDWVGTAFEEDLIDPESLQRDGVVDGQAMMAGTQTYGLNRASGMAQWQNPDESAEAGNFKMIPMPGETGETLGFVRFYGVTNQVPERGDAARDAAEAFLVHFGGPGEDGDWPVVKEWVRRWGLGFGYQSLFEDPEVRESFGEWTDVDVLEEIAVNARARKLSEWYPQWDVFTRGELQRAYLGQISTEEAVRSIAEQWNDLRG